MFFIVFYLKQKQNNKMKKSKILSVFFSRLVSNCHCMSEPCLKEPCMSGHLIYVHARGLFDSYQKSRKLLIFILFFISISNCASTGSSDLQNSQSENNSLSQNDLDYFSELNKWTRFDKSYDGLSNTIDMGVTLLNPVMVKSQIKQKAIIFGWTSEMQNEELKKNLILDPSIEFYLSFYTPDRKSNQLESEKSTWQIFLNHNGKRYLAKVFRIKEDKRTLYKLYPHQTPWHKPYKVTFDLKLKDVQPDSPIEFQISGPLGQSKVQFFLPLTSK